MAGFEMCPLCRREYEDPRDRRFHTQPTACPVCGPHLALHHTDGSLISRDIGEIIGLTLKGIGEGKIFAIKGTGGYLLAADARNDAAVIELRRRKGRPFKPFALMAGSIEAIAECLEISEAERDLLLSKERPIVLLKEKRPFVSPHVAPSIPFHGVMLPYMPFHYQLFERDPNMVLIMTSGNVSEEPIIFRDEDAFSHLAPIAD
jgi:hydrogenase maturation protein HypF